MRKEKKIKEKEHSKKTMYIVGGAIAFFLLLILGMNLISSFNKMETQDCVRNMVVMEKGMMKMQEEFRFDIPANIEFPRLARMMAYYFHFGETVFENPTTGTLVLKPDEQLKSLPLTEREAKYVLDIPECPSGGVYSLVRSEEYPGLYNIVCSEHGKLYLPDQNNNFAFTGKLSHLNSKKTELGREAELYFSPEVLPDDYVVIVPYGQKKTVSEEETGETEQTQESE